MAFFGFQWLLLAMLSRINAREREVMLETQIGDEISKGYYILFTSIMIGSEEFGAEGGGARPLP